MASHRSSPLLHWLAIMALLVNALLPGWAHAAWQQADGSAGTAAGIDLCLSGMAASATSSAEVTEAADGSAGHTMSTDMACCAICLSQAGSTWTAAATTRPHRPTDATPSVAPPQRDGTAPVATPAWPADAARAPPLN